MKTTAANLPWIDRKTSKRFVCFYTYLGELCASESLPPRPILSRLALSREERQLVAKWMRQAGAGDFHPTTPKSVVVCVKGRRNKEVSDGHS
jgi:hypothetical protein